MMLRIKQRKANSRPAPVVSKIYCAPSQVVLVVRRRPHVINGGGFVVTDCNQKVVFTVDGCGIIGAQGELLLRDANGDPLLLIRRKGGVVQAVSINKKWKGYAYDYSGSKKLVFTLREPNASCLAKNAAIKISRKPPGWTWPCGKDRDLEIKGYFPDRACSIVEGDGNAIAEVGMKEEVGELMMASKDLYNVSVKPGVDQAFVFGVIAVLDYIYGESTVC